MKEYIERAAAMKSIIGLTIVDPAVAQYANAVYYNLQSLPAADVVEVRHGRWIFDHMTGEWSYYSYCSECNYQEFFANEDAEKRHKYCPNCGARMDKEEERGTD